MDKKQNWNFKEDMINERDIVPLEEILSEEKEGEDFGKEGY